MANIGRLMILAGAALAMATGAPLAAQEEMPLEAGKPWVHDHSGIAVPAAIDGIQRLRGVRFADDDLDVAISFVADSPKEIATVYVFRNTNGAAPVWLAQAQWSLENGKSFGAPSLALKPVAFTPAGQASATGLLTVYGLTGSDYRSTGIAIFPVGEWYVKIRTTSALRSPEENAAWMERIIASLRLPAVSASAAAAPVVPCTTPLAAVSSTESPVAQGAGISQPADRIVAGRWCRDANLSENNTVYRPVGTNDRYLLAMGDNGNAVSVRGEGGYYSESFIIAGMTFALPPQDGLPTPQRVLDLIAADKAVGSFKTWPPR